MSDIKNNALAALGVLTELAQEAPATYAKHQRGVQAYHALRAFIDAAEVEPAPTEVVQPKAGA